MATAEIVMRVPEDTLRRWIGQEIERLQTAFQDAWAERNEARDRVTAALAIHHPRRALVGKITHGGPSEFRMVCDQCSGVYYPCPTARALGVTE